MKLRINRTHFPVVTLGYGRRIGIWFQGCDIGCAGCCARDTWDRDGGSGMEVAAIVAWCRSAAEGGCDGVTISGGEPFEQSKGLAVLVNELARWRCERAMPLDILCYSGLPLKRLMREHRPILAGLDAIVPEPFVRARTTSRSLRGSDNQPLVALSALGRTRYTDQDEAAPTTPKRLQVIVDGREIQCIGIPGRGDLERLEAAMQARGVVLGDVSWRA